MRRAARSADAVVPIVSLPSLQSNLPHADDLIRGEWADRMTAVVITKIQQEVVEVERKEELAVVIWNTEDRSKDVFCCDSLLGLGGLRLRDHLSEVEGIPQIFEGESDPIGEGLLQKFNDKNDPISEV